MKKVRVAITAVSVVFLVVGCNFLFLGQSSKLNAVDDVSWENEDVWKAESPRELHWRLENSTSESSSIASSESTLLASDSSTASTGSTVSDSLTSSLSTDTSTTGTTQSTTGSVTTDTTLSISITDTTSVSTTAAPTTDTTTTASTTAAPTTDTTTTASTTAAPTTDTTTTASTTAAPTTDTTTTASTTAAPTTDTTTAASTTGSTITESTTAASTTPPVSDACTLTSVGTNAWTFKTPLFSSLYPESFCTRTVSGSGITRLEFSFVSGCSIPPTANPCSVAYIQFGSGTKICGNPTTVQVVQGSSTTITFKGSGGVNAGKCYVNIRGF